MKLLLRHLALALIWIGVALIAFLLGNLSANQSLPVGQPTETVDERISTGETRWDFNPHDPLLNDRRILIVNEINDLVSQEVITKLLYYDKVDPSQPIEILLNTTGGYINDAMAIVHAMRLVQSPIDVWALGSCESAAAHILAGATGKRVAFEDTIIMIHFPEFTGASGQHQYGTAQRSRVESFWKDNSNIPESWLRSGQEYFYLTAREALQLEIVDEIFTEGSSEKPPL